MDMRVSYLVGTRPLPGGIDREPIKTDYLPEETARFPLLWA
jgi:hypothetical protein